MDKAEGRYRRKWSGGIDCEPDDERRWNEDASHQERRTDHEPVPNDVCDKRAKEAVMKADSYASRDRRNRKRDSRRLWITRLNAAARTPPTPQSPRHRWRAQRPAAHPLGGT